MAVCITIRLRIVLFRHCPSMCPWASVLLASSPHSPGKDNGSSAVTRGTFALAIVRHVDAHVIDCSSCCLHDSGVLVAWNFERGVLHTIQTERGHIRRVQFEPPSKDKRAGAFYSIGLFIYKNNYIIIFSLVHLLVHFNDGSCAVWDFDKTTRVSSSTYLTQRYSSPPLPLVDRPPL